MCVRENVCVCVLVFLYIIYIYIESERERESDPQTRHFSLFTGTNNFGLSIHFTNEDKVIVTHGMYIPHAVFQTILGLGPSITHSAPKCAKKLQKKCTFSSFQQWQFDSTAQPAQRVQQER